MLSHQGEIIEKVIRREGPSLTDLAKLMNVSRRSLYNWFTQRKLKPEIIVSIGRTMNYDFSSEFPGLFTSDEFKVESVQPTPESSINVWQEKYIDLLERYNFLLEIKGKKSANPVDLAYNVTFLNKNSNEYKVDLNNAPSEIFIEKCKRAGYKIKSINRGEIPRERIIKQMNPCFPS